MTESLGLRVHSFAPRRALQLSHVIQRERGLLSAVIQREPTATEESPGWFHRGNDNAVSSSAVILALRAGLPPMVPPG